jgi:8-oxo-dGTP diphosphatase
MTQTHQKVRVRVCGICLHKERILLVKQTSLPHVPYLWIPAGGGVEYGETLEMALQREFLEETTLTVEVGRFLFMQEYIFAPLHAIELFFEVQIIKGEIKEVYYPENEPYLEQVRWMTYQEIEAIPNEYKATFLQKIENLAQIRELKGIVK